MIYKICKLAVFRFKIPFRSETLRFCGALICTRKSLFGCNERDPCRRLKNQSCKRSTRKHASLDITNSQLSTEHSRKGAVGCNSRNVSVINKQEIIMSNLRSTLSNTTVELTAKGVFEIRTTPACGRKRRQIAKPIRLRAIGKKEDGVTLAQIYRTRHGDSLCGFFPWSSLLPENRKTIKNALADRGYEWPRDPTLLACTRFG